MAGTFGQTLKKLREAAGLTQAQLAAKADLHMFGVAKLEQGLREPTWATVRALARALGVTCQAFETDAADPPADEPSPARGRPRKAEGRGKGKRKGE